MRIHRTIPALSISTMLLLGTTGCSDFITLKDNPPVSAPASDYDVPASPNLLEDRYQNSDDSYDSPEPTSTSSASPTAASPPPTSDGIPTQKEDIEARTNVTLNKIVELGRSDQFQQFLDEAGMEYVDSTVVSSGEATSNAIANHRSFVDTIHTVFTISDEHLENVAGDATPEQKLYLRDKLVLDGFYQITMYTQKDGDTLFVAPYAIVTGDDGKTYFAGDGSPKAIVILRPASGGIYKYVRGFENLRIDDNGAKIVMDGAQVAGAM